ncbi:MAG: response regulator [Myxococcales bacterium]
MADCRVLVVEDDQDTREAIVDLLKTEKYDALGAANGKQALDILHRGEFAPDVIVLDLYMPTMNGHELRAALQAEARWANIPVVLCSGTPESPGAAFETLQKPVDIDALLDVIRRGCALRSPNALSA